MRTIAIAVLAFTLSCEAQQPSDALQVAPEVMAAQSISKTPPLYPPIARAAHVQGDVVVRALIGTDGSVVDAEAISGPAMLRRSAVDAVLQWTYQPFLKNGKPMVVQTTVTVHYEIAKEAPPSVTDSPVRIAAGMMAGHIVQKANPVYPPEARAAHVEGTVVMHAIIGKDGTIRNLTVESGPEMLRDSAVEAVRQWTYQPYLLNGEPVEVNTAIAVNYKMEATSPPPPPARVRVSAGVMAALLEKKVMPVWPPDATRQNVNGTVVLHVVIGKDGSVIEADVISGPEVLRPSYLEAVQQWQYRPYLLNGEPVEVDTTIAMNVLMAAER